MKKKQLALLALLLGIATYGINQLAGAMSWYWIMWWFDMPMHFLGGFFSAVLIMLFFYRRLRYIDTVNTTRALLYLVAGTVVLGLVWELHEVVVERAIPAGMDIVSFVDSISDLFFDTAGGLLAYLVVWKKPTSL